MNTRERRACIDCRGLGAWLSWNGSTDDPQLEPRTCDVHPLPGVEGFEAASERIDQLLDALADVRDILAKTEDEDGMGSFAKLDAITQRLAFLKQAGPP